MTYPALLLLHLFSALAFVGIVFYEVLMLEGVRKRLGPHLMGPVEAALGARARRIVPWVILSLYGAGIGLAWHHRQALAQASEGGLGFFLSIKIALALSVFAHFATVMWLGRRGRMTHRRSRLIHLSVFGHVIAIVALAKLMFYIRL